ncbi:hypothetical protein CORC01_10810 [Colletotrichum orchidophilum]|uniref:Uncharacterized protein n=1 Tax=Colletotrichum orchidophilum TaxID=1209926 RepID=A0A1G4AXQ6_9PEZI|nr:uncharacterized protein CORC01_10810 [Colletotrichum orchidophilum]OHE93911.1 hypothetical protein CORC01_10810 [Colletotrichum orchidophilum]
MGANPIALVSDILAICVNDHWKDDAGVHSKLVDACVALISSFPCCVQAQIRTKLDDSTPAPSFQSAGSLDRWIRCGKVLIDIEWSFGYGALMALHGVVNLVPFATKPPATWKPSVDEIWKRLQERDAMARTVRFAKREEALSKYISEACAPLNAPPKRSKRSRGLHLQLKQKPSRTDGHSTTASGCTREPSRTVADQAASTSPQEQSFMPRSPEPGGECGSVLAVGFPMQPPAGSGLYSTHDGLSGSRAPQTGMDVDCLQYAASLPTENSGPSQLAFSNDGNRQALGAWSEPGIWGALEGFEFAPLPLQNDPYKNHCPELTHASMGLPTVWL